MNSHDNNQLLGVTKTYEGTGYGGYAQSQWRGNHSSPIPLMWSGPAGWHAVQAL